MSYKAEQMSNNQSGSALRCLLYARARAVPPYERPGAGRGWRVGDAHVEYTEGKPQTILSVIDAGGER